MPSSMEGPYLNTVSLSLPSCLNSPSFPPSTRKYIPRALLQYPIDSNPALSVCLLTYSLTLSTMNRPFCLLLLLLCCLPPLASSAQLRCDGVLAGPVHTNVLVSGGSCEVTNGTINGDVYVRSGGSLYIRDGVRVNGDISLRSAGEFQVNGRYDEVTINGSIHDVNGTGMIVICGTRLRSRFRSRGRKGDIYIGSGSCYSSRFRADISVSAGQGTVDVDRLNRSLSALSVRNRDGPVRVIGSAITDRIFVKACTDVSIQESNVKHSTRLVDNDSVYIYNSSQRGTFVVRGTKNTVVASTLTVRREARIIGNMAGTIISESSFNSLWCEGNAEPFRFYDTVIRSGKGQCRTVSSE